MFWRHSLLLRLLAPYLATLVAVVASLYAYTDRVGANLHLETLSEAALAQGRLLGDLLPWDERGKVLDEHCARLAASIEARITVIAADGTVLGDSATPSAGLANHGGRPEVRAALHEGEGYASRLSASVKASMFYSAWRQTRGDATRVIRLSIPITRIDRARDRLRMAAWVGLAVAALAALWPALLISRRVSRRVERLADFAAALGRGEEPPTLSSQGSDVIGRLEARLIEVSTNLSGQVRSAQAEREKLAAALRGMQDAVLVLDEGSTVVLCNRRADELFNVPRGNTCLGRPLIDVTREPEILEIARAVMAADDSGEPLLREVAIEQPRRQAVQVTANRMSGPGGGRTYLLVCHDITELKLLQNNQREFVANVSHELRTPLSAIQGYSETLLASALENPEKGREFLAIIERHTRRLGRLVDDLLTLSDLELGRTELRRRPVAPASVMESACEVLRQRAQDGGLTLRTDAPGDLPPLDVDADRIVQALLNLVDNAVKYTPPGGSVTVAARSVGAAETRDVPEAARAEGWVEIAVADTGVGVPSQDLPNLTRRFYRVGKARSRDLGGTGLGLAIVKHIVQAHGGWLCIESVLNHGTTVRVYLPAAPGDRSFSSR